MAGIRRRSIVTGQTVVIPLIGHPVAQVKSPGPMNRWFFENDIDAVVVPLDIRPERVESFFDVLRAMENSAGCSITMPHKQAAFLASDEVTDRARRAKAVNTIRRLPSGRLIGDMTDGMALIAALGENDVTVMGCNVLLIGAGGAGTAIAFELAEEGARSVILIEPDQMRKRALISALSEFRPGFKVFDRVPAGLKIDIAINASPMGMSAHDPLPYPIERLADALILADAVTKPVITPWLIEAEKLGIKTQNGEQMAVAQLPIQLGYLRFMPMAVKSANGSKADAARSSVGDVTE